jgi:hypothetical protein
MVRDAGEQDGCTVSNPAKISGKLPDNGSHETLPAKAFLITEVTGIWTSGIPRIENVIQLPARRKFRVGILRKIANTSGPVLKVNPAKLLFLSIDG